MLRVGGVLVILLILFCVAIGPIQPGGIRQAAESGAMQTTRTVALAMFAYSNDHGQNYPDGNSSTEVFQKLMDGGYITDLNIFYLPMDGKIAPVSGQKLKPENISFDVTGGVDAGSPDELPVVFMTGYKVVYASGAAAVPLVKPYPRFGWVNPDQDFFDWLINRHEILYSHEGGLPLAYKSNSAMFKRLETSGPSAGTIPNFVSPDFKPGGKTYRQLTPEGPLP
jgi:hypothetical protein